MRELRRLGIIGVGIAGRARARAIREHHELELIGAYRGRYLSELEIPAFASTAELLGAVNGVVIASPNHTHQGLIREALEAKVHVCVEFPAVLPGEGAVQELQSLFDLARTQDRVLHVEHIELLSGLSATLKQHLRDDRVRQIECSFTRPTPSGDSHTLAAAALPRLHRVSALAGAITAIRSVSLSPNALTAVLTAEDCPVIRLSIEQSPSLKRGLVLRVTTERGQELRVDGRVLTVDGAAVPLEPTGPLFAADLDVFVERVKGGVHYVSEAQLLHILDVSSRLAASKVGPVAPRQPRGASPSRT